MCKEPGRNQWSGELINYLMPISTEVQTLYKTYSYVLSMVQLRTIETTIMSTKP